MSVQSRAGALRQALSTRHTMATPDYCLIVLVILSCSCADRGLILSAPPLVEERRIDIKIQRTIQPVFPSPPCVVGLLIRGRDFFST